MERVQFNPQKASGSALSMSDKATQKSYSELAREYDNRWKKYLNHTHSAVLDGLHLPANAVALDVSAGTGLFQKRMIEQGVEFQQFVLNDLSEGMLEVARSRFSDDHRFTFNCENAESLSFEDNRFDAVFCLSAFHNYQHQETVCQEIYRVLKPGGVLYMLDWNNSGLFRLVNFYIDKVTPEIIKTCSAKEVHKKLDKLSFQIENQKEWWFGWWKFYLISARK